MLLRYWNESLQHYTSNLLSSYLRNDVVASRLQAAWLLHMPRDFPNPYQGRRHGFESGGDNFASGASQDFFWPPTFWPVGGQNIA